MAKGEFDMLYLCAGGGGCMIFSFHKSTSLEEGSESEKKNLELIRGILIMCNFYYLVCMFQNDVYFVRVLYMGEVCASHS